MNILKLTKFTTCEARKEEGWTALARFGVRLEQVHITKCQLVAHDDGALSVWALAAHMEPELRDAARERAVRAYEGVTGVNLNERAATVEKKPGYRLWRVD